MLNYFPHTRPKGKTTSQMLQEAISPAFPWAVTTLWEVPEAALLLSWH